MIKFIEVIIPWLIIGISIVVIVRLLLFKINDYLLSRLMIIGSPIAFGLAVGFIAVGLLLIQCGGWISSGCN